MRLIRYIITFALGFISMLGGDLIEHRCEDHVLSDALSFSAGAHAVGNCAWIVIVVVFFGLTIAFLMELIAARASKSTVIRFPYLKAMGIYFLGLMAAGMFLPART